MYDDNTYHVVTGSYTVAAAILDGFTVTAGNADGGGYHYNGAAMYNFFGSPTLTNCTFSGNSAFLSGGMHNQSGSPTLTNCTFSGNSADYAGGGMWDSGAATLTNCTFSANSASGDGGGVYNTGSPTLTNCILWGNSDSDGTDESAQIHGGTPTVNYSCVQGWLGGLGGTGNFGDDPLLVDADGPDDIPGTEDDNLRLAPGSPCIDAANNAAVPPDTPDLDGDGDTDEPIPFDLDGNPRFVDDPDAPDCWQKPGQCGKPPVVDMGAYEYQVSCEADADCDDADSCTVDVCNAGVCDNTGIECGEGEVCIDGECVDLCTGVDCNDHNACTEDWCDPSTGECLNTPLVCDEGEICVAGECVSDVCRYTDADGDGDIDLGDFAVFQNCMSGPGE